MSKNQNNGGFLHACAFWALILAVVILAVGSLLDGSKLYSYICMAKEILVILGISIAAYGFVVTRKNPQPWKVVYWVAILVWVVLAVLGGIGILSIF